MCRARGGRSGDSRREADERSSSPHKAGFFLGNYYFKAKKKKNRSREGTKDWKRRIASPFLRDQREEAREEWRARRSAPTLLPRSHWIHRYQSSCTTSPPATACQPPPTLTAWCLQVIAHALFNVTAGFFFLKVKHDGRPALASYYKTPESKPGWK